MRPTSNNRNDLKPQTQLTLPDLDKLIPFVNSQSSLETSYILGCSFTYICLATKSKKKTTPQRNSFPNISTEGNKNATCWKQRGKNWESNSAAKQIHLFLTSQLKDAWIFMLVFRLYLSTTLDENRVSKIRSHRNCHRLN